MNQNRGVDSPKKIELKERVLHTAVKSFCDCPFLWSQLEAAGMEQGLSGAELAVSSVLLRRAGELIAYRLADGRVEYRLTPAAIYRSYGSFWGAEKGSLETDRGETRKGGALSMFRLLAYIANEQIALTRAGEAPARLLVKLASLLGLSSSLAAFCLRAAIQLKLAEGKQELVLNAAHLSCWLQLSPSWMEAVLYKLWVDESVPFEPKLRHFCYIGNRFNGTAIPAEDPYSILKAYIDVTEAEQEDIRFKLLQPMCAFGWASVEEAFSGHEFYRLLLPDPFLCSIEQPQTVACQGEASPMKWYIQPDFEVWTVGETNYALLWELQLMCEERNIDHHDFYSLSPSSWQKALSSGRSTEDCLHFLDKHSMGGVPENVRIAVLNWGITREGDEEAAELMKNRRQSTFGYPRLNDTPGHFNCRLTTRNDASVMERMPGPEDLFPGLNNAPLSWFRDCRAYHTTTSRDIAAQAIKWKTFLRVRTETMEQIIQPLHVRTEKNVLLLDAFHQGKAMQLTLNRTNRLQILLPEMGGV
ncbi:MAG: hypothetical protein H7X86_01570 [Gorillibacterium sp.]|nr:hypothetical protein [Gorillibacterium sp.]